MSVALGLVRTLFNAGSDGDASDPEWDLTVVLSPSSLDGGALSDDQLTITLPRVSPAQARATYAQLPTNAVVLLEVERNSVTGEWTLRSIIGTDPTDDPRILELAIAASPPEDECDIATDAEGLEHVVPDVWRRAPVELPGVGLVSPVYRVDNKLSLPTFTVVDQLTDPLEQSTIGSEPMQFSIWEPDAHSDLAATAIRNFCAGGASLRDRATPYVYAYYAEFFTEYGSDGTIPAVTLQADVWDLVSTRTHGAHVLVEDGVPYVLVEADCVWEPEHGLQLVFANGNEICKVSEYDGYPLNDDPSVVYRARFA